MGEWAKSLFGRAKFGKVGLVLAGTIKPELEKEILGMFDEVISSKDAVYHAHLVRKCKNTYPIVSNVYGAPAMVDVLTEMHDGGCQNVIFVGYAYGFKNLEVGTIVIPEKSFHFEGIYHPLEPNRKADYPNKELKRVLEDVFKKSKLKFINGTNISVPAVTFQLPHANEEYKKIQPTTVEMELASCLSRSKDIGVRSVGVLIISDNRSSSIADTIKKKLRHSTKKSIVQTIVNNLDKFSLSPLKIKKMFSVDEHLAAIIEDPDDITNVYRKKK